MSVVECWVANSLLLNMPQSFIEFFAVRVVDLSHVLSLVSCTSFLHKETFWSKLIEVPLLRNVTQGLRLTDLVDTVMNLWGL